MNRASKGLVEEIDNPWVPVPGESMGIGDSGFPVYSSVTIPVPVEVFGPGKGYVWWTEFGDKWCSTRIGYFI